MKQYIESLKIKLENSICENEQKDIISTLEEEREACKRILNSYKGKEPEGETESEIIKQINKILNSLNENNENCDLN